MTFSELGLIEPLLRAVQQQGYTAPTTIQSRAVPPILQGSDVLGLAQTGTGKTAAFTLPILQRLAASKSRRPHPRALILTPTRELAQQIGQSVKDYGRHLDAKHCVIVGGVGFGRQIQELRQGIDILIATPGRLLDLISQRNVSLSAIEILVLDEADRMLDMGFIRDIRKILALVPKERQTLFFSATMPPEVSKLSASMLRKPERLEVAPKGCSEPKISQSIYEVPSSARRELLVELLRSDETMQRVLIFTRTKHGADRLTKDLDRSGFGAAAIHGNKRQNAREKALREFRNGKIKILVATDVAARGIDVDNISHVVNYDLPNLPETYVHRIGRTARAGASGVAISFWDQQVKDQRDYLRDIEALLRTQLPRVKSNKAPAPPRPTPPARYARATPAARDRRPAARAAHGGRR